MFYKYVFEKVHNHLILLLIHLGDFLLDILV